MIEANTREPIGIDVLKVDELSTDHVGLKHRLTRWLNDRLFHGVHGDSTDVKRVMVYSPNTGGHRHLYCKKFVDFLADHNKEIIFAYRGLHSSGDVYLPHTSEYLDRIAQREQVTMVCVNDRDFSDEMGLVVSLQKEYNVDLTLFVDGDVLQWQFASQLLPYHPRLRGRNYAVFMRNEWMHVPEATPIEILSNKFFLWLLRNFDILDGVFHTDVNIAQAGGTSRFIHIPDFVHSPLESNEDGDPTGFYARLEERYREFLKRHNGKEVVLSLGDLEPRKGLDFLLRLVADHDDLVLVRSGRTKPGHARTWEEVLNKEKLIFEERLFEVDAYLNHHKWPDLFFDSIKFLTMPYKRHYITSGVMLDAIVRGKPVLTPDVGLLGQRVRQHGLGLVFKHLDYDSFHAKFHELQGNLPKYRQSIQSYQSELSEERFRQTVRCLIGEQPPDFVLGSNLSEGKPPPRCVSETHGSLAAMKIYLQCFAFCARTCTRFLLQFAVKSHLRLRWRMIGFNFFTLRTRRVAIFGAGKHTRWLESVVPRTSGLLVTHVLDDNSNGILREYWGCRVSHPSELSTDGVDAIVLSTDTPRIRQAMLRRCRELYGRKVPVINLYAGLPPSLYRK